MSDWTNSHDLVYAFVCVSFLADGDVDESEKEAMRGNVKVMLPDMGDDEYHQVEKEVIDKLKVDIEDILDGKVNNEEKKLDLLKQISNLKIKLDRVSEEDEAFDESEFQKKLRIDELIEKEEELWERVKKFGRD